MDVNVKFIFMLLCKFISLWWWHFVSLRIWICACVCVSCGCIYARLCIWAFVYVLHLLAMYGVMYRSEVFISLYHNSSHRHTHIYWRNHKQKDTHTFGMIKKASRYQYFIAEILHSQHYVCVAWTCFNNCRDPFVLSTY